MYVGTFAVLFWIKDVKKIIKLKLQAKWNINEVLKGIGFTSNQQNSTKGSRPWFELKWIKVVRNFPVLYMISLYMIRLNKDL